MGRDTPRPERDPKERGLHAKHREDPTRASYISSAFYALSVPTLIALAVGGWYFGFYAYRFVIPVFAALLVCSITIAFAVMHVYSTR